MTRPPNPELVDALLRITTDLIIEKGPRNVTLREIAGLAGVTPTTIHYYFDDKRGLFEATKLRAVAELDAAVDASVDASADAVAQLRQLATAFVGWSVANPHGFALVFDALPPRTEQSEVLTRQYYATFERLQAIFARGMERGELACGDADARAAVGFATLFGLSHLYIKKRLPRQYWDDPTPLVEDAMGVFLSSCAPPPVESADLAPVVPISGPRALSDGDLEGLAAAGQEPEQLAPESRILMPGELR